MTTLPHKADGAGQVSPLTGTPQRTDRIWDLPFLLMKKDAIVCQCDLYIKIKAR